MRPTSGPMTPTIPTQRSYAIARDATDCMTTSFRILLQKASIRQHFTVLPWRMRDMSGAITKIAKATICRMNIKVGRWLTASESARSEDHVKNPFKNLFDSSNESEQDRLTQAEAHISQCKGVYDHYNMQGVVDTVRQFTNVKDFTVVEAVQIVNKK